MAARRTALSLRQENSTQIEGCGDVVGARYHGYRSGQAMPGEAAEHLDDDLFKGESSWHRTRAANQRPRLCARDGIT